MLVPIQKQLGDFWQHQSRTRRILLIALVLIAVILTIVFVVWATTPTYTIAFSGLSEEDAGAITTKLTELGIAYKLQDTSSILVESSQVYQARLSMASEGLPESSTVGYELFSSNTLGMTEFTQQVNYQRALEGELERTIGSLEPIETVRVHVVTPEKTLLSSEQETTTASVTVGLKKDMTLTSSQVKAITHLVASSIEGLKAENIVVIDSKGNMLTRSADGSQTETDMMAIQEKDYQHQIESQVAKEIQNRVQNLLDGALGPDRAIAQATVELDWTKREINSQVYNPTPAAVRSSQIITETYTTDGSVEGGTPGAGSNLPTPVPTLIAGATGAISYSRAEQVYNYEITLSESKEVIAPGDIKRISVSVMVDSVDDPVQLASLKSAISAAAGINEARGDMIAVETIAFDRTYTETETAAAAQTNTNNLLLQIGQVVLIVLILLGLLLYIRSVLKNIRKASTESWIPIMRPVTEAALPEAQMQSMFGGYPGYPGLKAAQGGTIGYPGMPGVPQPVGMPGGAEQPTPEAGAATAGISSIAEAAKAFELAMPTKKTTSAEFDQLQRVMTRLTEENPATIAEIVQLWLSEDEKS